MAFEQLMAEAAAKKDAKHEHSGKKKKEKGKDEDEKKADGE